MKLRQPRISQEKKEQILQDYKTEGMSIEQILKRNKISVGSLYRIIKQKI